MPGVELDLRGLEPGVAPAKDDVAPATEAESVVVRGPVPALAGVLSALLRRGRTAEVPVAWEPAEDTASAGLARALGIGSGRPRQLGLVRDDHGGVLLHHGRIEPSSEDPRRGLSRRLGLPGAPHPGENTHGLLPPARAGPARGGGVHERR